MAQPTPCVAVRASTKWNGAGVQWRGGETRTFIFSRKASMLRNFSATTGTFQSKPITARPRRQCAHVAADFFEAPAERGSCLWVGWVGGKQEKGRQV